MVSIFDYLVLWANKNTDGFAGRGPGDKAGARADVFAEAPLGNSSKPAMIGTALAGLLAHHLFIWRKPFFAELRLFSAGQLQTMFFNAEKKRRIGKKESDCSYARFGADTLVIFGIPRVVASFYSKTRAESSFGRRIGEQKKVEGFPGIVSNWGLGCFESWQRLEETYCFSPSDVSAKEL